MQINPSGDMFAFPLLPEIEGETYTERLERSRKEGERQRAEQNEAIRRMFGLAQPALESVMSVPNGETVRDAQDWQERKERNSRLGHPRATVPRSATAGKW